MSAYGVKYYRTNGVLPGASRAPYGSSTIDPDKEAFSTAPHDDEYVPVQSNDHEADMHDHEDTVAGDQFDAHKFNGSQFDTSHKFDTSYNGYVPEHEGETELSYAGAGSSSSRVHFPPANYGEGRTPLQI